MVTLRPVELRDVDALYGFRMDEEVMFWASGGFGVAMHARVEIEEMVKSQKASGSSRVFVIEAEKDGKQVVIGQISFRDFNRINRNVTIGMFIGDRAFWGKGYGTDALEQFIRMLFTRYGAHRISMDTFADNKRAIRCYEKCGFAVEGVRRDAMWTMNGHRDQVMMGLLSADWLKKQGDMPYYL
ncbi:RimJ/RimL family protein N-acetyltransferase [Tumebacillus sp. BK434]|uniref:GNAT family N-acetyltransferase n=1 Tax=Tumebacillus sp. BK434 TaxID=2512169 RepID=UPI00104CC014|nr:GNAT family protein [Tumebacillus sp. BK434]TCP54645.1 RimJ/RimL family protein N-acetyltransferase [Tumebacillus sp. BK434]